MKRGLLQTVRLAALTVAACTLFLAGCATGGPGAPGAASTMPSHKYVCGCGAECDCGTSCDKAGSCTCGKPLVRKKVLREAGNAFYVCPDPTCKLEAADKNDPAKCACGKDLQAFRKKGKFNCACGGGCDCNCTSNKPGNCACGKKMF